MGLLYITEAGDGKGEGAAIYRINPFGRITLISDSKRAAALKSPRGVVMDGMSFLLVLDAISGELLRIKIADGSAVKIADGFGSGGGLAWDRHGRLYVTDAKSGHLFVIPRPDGQARAAVVRFSIAERAGLDPAGKSILVADAKAGTLTALAARPPLSPANRWTKRRCRWKRPSPFPICKWAGWNPRGQRPADPAAAARPDARRRRQQPRLRRHPAGRHPRLPQRPEGDARPRSSSTSRAASRYDDKQNEEGFLGLAFHPEYKKNGEFFVFYTDKKAKLTNVVSRFRVSKDDPDRADPDSEEELLRIEQAVLEPRRRHASSSARTATCTSRSATAAWPTTRTRTARTSRPCSARSCASTSTTRTTARTTPSPRTIRSSAARTRGRKSGPTACATSGGWRSTARPASCGRPTSARTCTRRSTSSTRAATTAGTSARGCTPSAPTASGRART